MIVTFEFPEDKPSDAYYTFLEVLDDWDGICEVEDLPIGSVIMSDDKRGSNPASE